MKPTLQEYLKENPSKTINDYFILYPYQNEQPTQKKAITDDDLKKQLLYVSTNEKNVILSLVLTLIFGPFGLFYASIYTAFYMLLAPIFGLIFGLLLPALCERSGSEFYCTLTYVYWGVFFLFIIFYWVICIILSITSVMKYNKNLKLKALDSI